MVTRLSCHDGGLGGRPPRLCARMGEGSARCSGRRPPRPSSGTTGSSTRPSRAFIVAAQSAERRGSQTHRGDQYGLPGRPQQALHGAVSRHSSAMAMVIHSDPGAIGAYRPLPQLERRSVLSAIRGIKVAYPSCGADLKGLLRVASPTPTRYRSNTGLYWSGTGTRPPGVSPVPPRCPLASPASFNPLTPMSGLRPGVVTYGRGVHWALAASRSRANRNRRPQKHCSPRPGDRSGVRQTMPPLPVPHRRAAHQFAQAVAGRSPRCLRVSGRAGPLHQQHGVPPSSTRASKRPLPMRTRWRRPWRRSCRLNLPACDTLHLQTASIENEVNLLRSRGPLQHQRVTQRSVPFTRAWFTLVRRQASAPVTHPCRVGHPQDDVGVRSGSRPDCRASGTDRDNASRFVSNQQPVSQLQLVNTRVPCRKSRSNR